MLARQLAEQFRNESEQKTASGLSNCRMTDDEAGAAGATARAVVGGAHVPALEAERDSFGADETNSWVGATDGEVEQVLRALAELRAVQQVLAEAV